MDRIPKNDKVTLINLSKVFSLSHISSLSNGGMSNGNNSSDVPSSELGSYFQSFGGSASAPPLSYYKTDTSQQQQQGGYPGGGYGGAGVNPQVAQWFSAVDQDRYRFQ